MTDNLGVGHILALSLALICQGCVTQDVQQETLSPDVSEGYERPALADEARLEKFAFYAEHTRYEIDHGPWATFLGAAVFDLGPSLRYRAPRRSGGVHTGTRISTASRSRYRYEGNRIMFHLFTDGTLKFLSTYRAEIAGLMDNYEYTDFGRDEQLAFWLNLHNAILIDEIAKRHPIGRPRNFRLRSHDNALLFDAKLIRVAGEPLSLNDIRHRIVYSYWNDPDVIYGFWDGTIGGVDIPTTAFTGKNVWQVLRSNGRRYVNSLRGVEPSKGSFGRSEFRVSSIYADARRLFPEWPDDLYAHLDAYAGVTVGRLLAEPPPRLRFVRYDSSTADFSGGEVARFSGNDNIAAMLSVQGEDENVSTDDSGEAGSSGAAGTILEYYGAPVQNRTMRGGVSVDSFKLKEREFEGRRRRDSDVNIEDVESPDPEASEEADADERDASENEN